MSSFSPGERSRENVPTDTREPSARASKIQQASRMRVRWSSIVHESRGRQRNAEEHGESKLVRLNRRIHRSDCLGAGNRSGLVLDREKTIRLLRPSCTSARAPHPRPPLRPRLREHEEEPRPTGRTRLARRALSTVQYPLENNRAQHIVAFSGERFLTNKGFNDRRPRSIVDDPPEPPKDRRFK